MSTPTFQTSLFSNLVMLTRNDDQLTMTGCLCRDVTARHFELNTPITIKLDELKDSLPDGSTHRIADELGISVETVRNYFGGHNFKDGKSCGIHIEPGPDGGLVVLDDTTIFERALQILAENEEVSEAQQA